MTETIHTYTLFDLLREPWMMIVTHGLCFAFGVIITILWTSTGGGE